MANGIKQRLNKSFSNVYDWFIDNKLIIYFVEEKAKRNQKKTIPTLDMTQYILSDTTQLHILIAL